MTWLLPLVEGGSPLPLLPIIIIISIQNMLTVDTAIIQDMTVHSLD
jgi:hypothetical protein